MINLLWFWVFAVLLTPFYLVVSSVALVQFRNVLVMIMDIKARNVPAPLAPVVTTLKSLIVEGFGNMRAYKPKMTEILLWALIVAILTLLPAIWELAQAQRESAKISRVTGGRASTGNQNKGKKSQ